MALAKINGVCAALMRLNGMPFEFFCISFRHILAPIDGICYTVHITKPMIRDIGKGVKVRMGILSAASGTSIWRGYQYFMQKKVVAFVKLTEYEYEGSVAGTSPEPYHVRINIAHSRQSKCDCPYANGTRIICKHMVALYFNAFPDEARRYIAEVEEYEKEEEERAEEHYKEIEAYVKGLSKKELQEELLQALIQLEEENSQYW